jgi:hypothetical protein
MFFIPEEFVGDNIRGVKDFPDVFPEELSRTAPISKRPYMMFVEELKELKKAVNRIIGCWVHSSEFFTLWSASSIHTEER